MTDKKLTQKEVIKAIECCINDDCDNCPNGFGNCERNLAELSLDLINRLKTRIVRYQLKNTNQRNALASLNKKVAEQKAEIERLTLEVEAVNELINPLPFKSNFDRAIETAKTEAIKKFAEKFREKSGSIVTSCQGYEIYETKQYQISAINFDNLVKEMTEVDK